MTSTTLGAPTTSPDELAPDQRGVPHSGWRTQLMRPGWPLRLLFYGYPVWWVLGVGELSFLVASIPMAVTLLHRRLRAPRGFSIWLLFLGVVAMSALVLYSDAPGMTPVHGAGRAFTFGYRALWYVALTIVLLYIGNMREDELFTRDITRMLAYMFCVVVAGGLLGVLAPRLEIKSVAEIVLPHALTSNLFVFHIVHPRTAEVQAFIGHAVARPTAPYFYTNSWGANLSLFLPFFILAWRDRTAGWRRIAAPVVLLIALIPIVYSLNRALWIAIISMTLFVMLRFTLQGRVRVIRAIVAGLAAAGLVFFATPLHSMVDKRLHTSHSNQRRGDLAGTTVKTALASPVIGYGGTQRVQGNFTTLNGGARPDCRSCAPPPLGTQGHLWLLLISQGFTGAALFLAFYARRFLRSWRNNSPYAIAGCAALIAAAVELPFYDLLGPPLFALMVVVGLLWRVEAARPVATPPSDRLPAVRARSGTERRWSA